MSILSFQRKATVAVLFLFSVLLASSVSAAEPVFHIVQNVLVTEQTAEITAGRISLTISNVGDAQVRDVRISLTGANAMFIGDLDAGETRNVETEPMSFDGMQATAVWEVEYLADDGSRGSMSVMSH